MRTLYTVKSAKSVGSRLAKSGIDPKTLRSMNYKDALLSLVENRADARLREIASNFFKGVNSSSGTAFQKLRSLNGLQVIGLLDKFANTGANTPADFREQLNKMFDRETWELANKKRYRMGANRR